MQIHNKQFHYLAVLAECIPMQLRITWSGGTRANAVT